MSGWRICDDVNPYALKGIRLVFRKTCQTPSNWKKLAWLFVRPIFSHWISINKRKNVAVLPLSYLFLLDLRMNRIKPARNSREVVVSLDWVPTASWFHVANSLRVSGKKSLQFGLLSSISKTSRSWIHHIPRF